MYKLKQIEDNTWADERKELFQLLGATKYQIKTLIFRKAYVVDERKSTIKTVEVLRPFGSLPKWLKKRMKHRLRHLYSFEVSQGPEFSIFIEGIMHV